MTGELALMGSVTRVSTAINPAITASRSSLWTESVLVSPDTQIRSLQSLLCEAREV